MIRGVREWPFSPDSKCLLYATSSGRIELWKLTEHPCTKEILYTNIHGNQLAGCLSADSESMVCSQTQPHPMSVLVDIKTKELGKAIALWPFDKAIYNDEIRRYGQYISFLMGNGSVVLWDTHDDILMQDPKPVGKLINVSFSAEERYIACIFFNGNPWRSFARIWNCSAQDFECQLDLVDRLLLVPAFKNTDVCECRKFTYGMFFGRTEGVCLWGFDKEALHELEIIHNHEGISDLDCTANGMYLCCACNDNSIILWRVDREKRSLIRVFQTAKGVLPVESVSFSENGQTLACV